jgi:hypothetical protein
VREEVDIVEAHDLLRLNLLGFSIQSALSDIDWLRFWIAGLGSVSWLIQDFAKIEVVIF